MQENLQLMAGFKDITDKLRSKYPNLRTHHELMLWFTYTGQILYVHDHESHDMSVAIAVCRMSENEWKILFNAGSHGEWLIKKAILENPKRPDKYLNEQYKSNGSFISRFFK
jgi:hypothetical protein